MVALQAILNPQEEVIFPAPYWVSYPEMAKLIGAVPVPVYPEDGTFYPRIQDIERVITSYTKAVIINSPNNPTGAMYSEEFISQIVELCEKKSLYLIMDDIYHRLIFDGRRPINCYKYANDLTENSKLIVINGVSKQYAMTGYRIGWAVANKKLIEVMTNIQSHQTSGPLVVMQKAAVGSVERLAVMRGKSQVNSREQQEYYAGKTECIRWCKNHQTGLYFFTALQISAIIIKIPQVYQNSF